MAGNSRSFSDFFDINPSRVRQQPGGFGFNSYDQNGSVYGGTPMRGSLMAKMQKFQRAQIQWSQENLTPFEKNFYNEHPNVAALTDDEVHQKRKDTGMIVFGEKVPKPFNHFSECGVPENYLKHLSKLDISEATPIQAQGIPMALSGRDLVGVSRTGSGKTLAYVLPLLVHIQAQAVVKPGEGPIGLILAPTRELARQIDTEIYKLVSSNPQIIVKHSAVYGGADRHKQISDLRQYPDILVATPGRLLDLLSSGETNFKRCTYLVLDEADRMLDMGFRDDLEIILSYVRPDRQTLMWSATWPQEIQTIAHRYMNDDFIRVQIGSLDLHSNANIDQSFKKVNEFEKMDVFVNDIKELCTGSSRKKVLVFTNTKRNADMLESTIQRRVQINARAIHGDKTQGAREGILEQFRRSQIQVLLATDVVARGIDIRDIDCVVLYDFPSNVEDFVHRVGRTGRGHDKGIAISYLTPNDIDSLGDKLKRVLKSSGQAVPDFLDSARTFFAPQQHRLKRY